MQIVLILAAIWIFFALLSWLLHAVKWMLVIAVIASLLVLGAKYLRRSMG